MQKKSKPTNSYETKYSSKREKDLFYSLCEKSLNQIKTKDLKNALLKSGLKSNDSRLYAVSYTHLTLPTIYSV